MNSEGKTPDMDNKKRHRFSLSWIYFALAAILIGIWFFSNGPQASDEISDQDFNEMVAHKEINYIQYVKKEMPRPPQTLPELLSVCN